MRGENVTWSEVRNACGAIGVLVLVCLCCCGISYAWKAMRYQLWHLEAEMTLQNTLSISKQALLQQMNAHPVFTASHFYTHIHYLFSEDAEVQRMVHDVLARNIDNAVTRVCQGSIKVCNGP